MSKTVKEKYLFVYNSNSYDNFFIAANVSNFKEAVIKLSNYTGTTGEIFLKALNGMETSEEMIRLFNYFAYCYTIEHVYKIESVVYGDTGEEAEGANV